MIHVIATIELNEGCKKDFLKILKENVPHVKAEKGCLAYEPAVDLASGLPVQGQVREDVVTIVEAWESMEALFGHLKMPHMDSYRQKTKGYVRNLSVRVLQPA